MSKLCALHFTGPPGSDVDDLGFCRPWSSRNATDEEKAAAQDYADFWTAYMPILVRRRKRWEKADPRTHSSLLQRFIYKGVPSAFRKSIWLRNCPPRGAPKSSAVPLSVVDEIRLDLARTFPDNVRLKTQQSQNVVGRILYELAKFFPEIGYCQGLNFIAAMIWIVLEDEQKAMDLLVYLIKPRKSWYGSDMAGLRRDMRVFFEILNKEVPVVCSVLRRLDVGLDLLIGKWFLCWFLEVLPMETVLRVWDCFIYEGDVWFFRVALRLFKVHATKIAACESMDALLTTIQSIGSSKHALRCHSLLLTAQNEHLSQEDVEVLRAQFQNDF